jgi:hypothetical protein
MLDLAKFAAGWRPDFRMRKSRRLSGAEICIPARFMFRCGAGMGRRGGAIRRRGAVALTSAGSFGGGLALLTFEEIDEEEPLDKAEILERLDETVRVHLVGCASAS